jgi:putative MATE family efflux protein
MTESTPTTTEKCKDQNVELITSGKISSAVWFVAWPTIINTLFHTAYNIINRIFLGHTDGDSSAALAAIGIGGVVLMVQQAVMVGVTTGASALTSRFLGAEENDNAEEATGQSIVLSTIAAVATAIPLAIWAVPIVTFAGAKGSTISLAADYLRIIAVFGSIPMFLRMTIQTALRSAGDTIRPLYAGAVLIGLNIALDLLLIQGMGMGVHGAAIATVISQFVAVIIITDFLRRSILGGSLRHLKPHPRWFARIMSIGNPAIAQNLMWSTGFAAFVKLLSYLPDPKNAQAALTVAITIEMVAFMPGVAYSIAATPLVGQNLGACKPKRAERSAWIATLHAMAIMSFVAILFLAIPRQLALIFTRKEPVVQHIITYLRINGVCEPFLAVAMVLTGALQGAGDTFYPMLIEFIASWIVRFSLAWYLGLHLKMGATGAWIAMSFSTFLYGVLIAIWFQRGNWRTIEV